MNTMTLMLLAGAATGLGVALLVFGLHPPRPALAEALDALSRPAAPAVSRRARLDIALARPLVRYGFPRQKTLRDLAILDRDPAEYLAQQITAAVAGTLILGMLPVLWGVGGQLPLWLGLLGGVIATRFAAARVHTAAEQRREQMRETLSAILDLVGGSLAGGAGIDQALGDTLDEVSGWAALRIRRELFAAAQTRGRNRVRTPAALKQLADEIGVDELAELAITVEQAATGAPVAETMSTLAHTVRERITADMERQANAKNAQLAVPIMLYGLGYLIFLLFAAIGSIRSGLAG